MMLTTKDVYNCRFPLFYSTLCGTLIQSLATFRSLFFLDHNTFVLYFFFFDCNTITMVGSKNDGTFANNADEGHPGWKIGDIAGIAANRLQTYKPNVVLLLIGTNDMLSTNVTESNPDQAVNRLASLLDLLYA